MEKAGQGKRPLCQTRPIFPLVSAQDKDHWTTSTRFHDLFSFHDEIQKTAHACIPDFAFRLLHLLDMPYEDIRCPPAGILTLRSLKAEPFGKLLHNHVWNRFVITGVSRQAVERFFRYILHA